MNKQTSKPLTEQELRLQAALLKALSTGCAICDMRYTCGRCNRPYKRVHIEEVANAEE